MKWYLMVLKKYAVFNGRARRKEYWMFLLFNMIFSYAFMFFGLMVLDIPQFSSIYSLAVLLPSLGVAIRRMHDVGKSGWFMLIPIYNIILAATDGDSGPNKYGDDPKGGGVIDTDTFGVAEADINTEAQEGTI
jgi:uncharacterized membrane protein YhaH (DUF805 family)